MRAKNLIGGLVVISTIGVSAMAHASSVDFSFNDLTNGALTGQDGGSGGNGTWLGSSGVVQVITGDLTAPGSTNFSVNQGGNPHSIQSTSGTTNSSAGSYRTLANAITGGTTWFSFLVDPVNDSSRVGIGINGTGSMVGITGEQRIIANGQGLFTTASSQTQGTPFTLGTGNLVLGEIISSGTNNEELKVWVNPNVQTFDPSTTAATYDSGAKANYGITTTGSITDITAISYTSGGTNTNGIIDNIVFSNDPNALNSALTGVTPEPSALALITLAGCGLLLRKRTPALLPQVRYSRTAR